MVAAKLHRPYLAGGLCVLILIIFVVAGLWPFHQIPNEVTWLANGPGVRFGPHGIILSADALPTNGAAACSMELWVRPVGGEGLSTLLAFQGQTGGVGLSLHQSVTDLRLDRETADGRPAKSYIDRILPNGKLVFLTVVIAPFGTIVYMDGVAVRSITSPQARAGLCSGRLQVGHSSKGHNSWHGEILGVAIYRRVMTPDQARANYQSWRTRGEPDALASGKPQVLYLFNEKSGRLVHDSGTSGLDLIIPDRYSNARRTLLQSPFSALETSWGYVGDIFLNVGGFIPFGFTFSLFLSAVGKAGKTGAAVVAGGLLVSLTIEVLQSYLPTRNSDLTDVLTNTLGTWLGAALYSLWQHRLAQRAD